MSIAWTMPKANGKNKKRRCDSPGPGNYNDVDVNLVRVAAPEWTIKGKYKGKSQLELSPGPGTYTQSSKRPGSAYTIQGKRYYKQNNDDPGPGTYVWGQQYDHIGGYIGKKFKNKHQEGTPGPAAYSLAMNRKSYEGWSFGMKLDDRFKILDAPGPGQYNGKNNSAVILGKFGKAYRGDRSTAYDSPGPGSYSQVGSLKSNGWTIQGKRPQNGLTSDEAPGPGSYFPLIRGDAPAYSIQGKSNKKVKAYDGPGPTAYFPSVNATRPRPKSAKFTSGRKDRLSTFDYPGPGNYKLKSTLGGPAYGIKGRYSTKFGSDGPGPGAYNVSKGKNRPASAKFGTAQRMGGMSDDNPGPGHYNGKKNSTVILGKFGKAYRQDKSTAYDSPGPGSYSHGGSMKTNGWTILGKGKHAGLSGDQAPGPGSYFPKIRGDAPAYSIQGRPNKKNKASNGPGPSAYFPSVNATKSRPKSANFTSGRKDRMSSEYPGPGDYKLKSTLGGPAYGIKGRPQTAYRTDGPGPGAYNVSKAKKRPASGKFGTAQRMGRKNDNNPGPGHYKDWEHLDKRGGKMGRSKRPASADTRQGPGPGAYSIKSTIGQNPGKTIAGRPTQKSFDNTPGPGSYNLKLGRGPAYSLQGRNAKDFDMLEQLKKPGPSAYLPNYDLTKPHNPGKSMGNRYGVRGGENIPGPGAYEFYDKTGKGNGWSMAHRPNTADTFNSPGPAAYFPKGKGNGPAYTMANVHRQPYNGDMNPGPDQYNLREPWNKGILMGKERRLQTAGAQSLVPGPGSYKLPNQFESPGKGVYMASRYPEKEYANTPGPGAYNPDGKRQGPHYSLTGSRLQHPHGSGPGPATYEVDKSYKTVYNTKGGAAFGSDLRQKTKNNDSPGPGAYYLPRPNTGGISMKWRHPDSMYERSPGPAAYDQKWQTIQNTADAQKPVPMSGAHTGIDFYGKGGIPGPGTYYSPSKLDGKGVKFTQGPRSGMKSNENPGPGYYYVPCTVADVPRYVLPHQNERYKWV